MSMPKADEATRAYFHSLLPEDPRVSVRPMFGNLAGFVNGHMFTGIFGESVFVRLPEEARTELLAIPDAELFEPMAGRPMREYVTFPVAWREDQEQARAWVQRSLDWAGEFPLKEAKPKKKRGAGKE
jgi:TfoX/Sxy family transcriptional regulator of competence genes